MRGPNVTVNSRKAPKGVDPRTIRRRLITILSHLELKSAELSCVLCDDKFIQNLNKAYRGKNKPTDVLSFSMNEGEPLSGNADVLGDIVVSVETAIRQGEALGHSLLEETTSLVIHGLLHLLGYDHQRPKDENEMQRKARELEALFPAKQNRKKHH